MDWSLVLLSQGIEPVIDCSEETAAWGLLVPAKDHQTAQEALHLYRVENRRWPWRRELFQQGVLFDWGSLAWAVLLAFFYWVDAQTDLRSAGLMDSVAASRGQWWRLFTAVWLHADLAHLASNAVIGLVLLGLTMARYGTGAGLLAAYLAGAGGNLVVWLLSPASHLSLGASGMVMGALGLLAIQSLPLRRGGDGHVPELSPLRRGGEGDDRTEFESGRLTRGRGRPRPNISTRIAVLTRSGRPHRTVGTAKHVVTGVLAAVLLFVLLGLAPGTDVMAHAGGFVAGILLGGLLKLVPCLARQTKTNLLGGFLFILLVLWPWWLALRHR
ncbi:MAG TPA: rhomboid family intramembrane serine protease [Candidatus Acidoferrum sp.]|nr:rhomboid family intramembrane serine protease [Candidatus Acidoferrum sp.]